VPLLFEQAMCLPWRRLSRLVAIPQGVDTEFFNPRKHAPIPLPTGRLVLGKGMGQQRDLPGQRRTFVFLSVGPLWAVLPPRERRIRSFTASHSNGGGHVLFRSSSGRSAKRGMCY